MASSDFKKEKVLIFGLGLLGGGVATTNWFLKHGAMVTVTDLKDENQLAPSLKKFRGKVVLHLNGHRTGDIRKHDIIVVNPDVSFRNRYIRLAQRLGKRVENEATLFMKEWGKPVIGITGTRGKTTVTEWTNHFLCSKFMSVATGNSYKKPFLSVLDHARLYDIVAAELSSFALEFFHKDIPQSHVAVITNVYRDHMNRYQSVEDYASVKANIFRFQKNGHLILNADDRWTKFLLTKTNYSWLWFTSFRKLSKLQPGVFVEKNVVFFKFGAIREPVLQLGSFASRWGMHNVSNLMQAALAAYLAGVAWPLIQKRIATLPDIEFRQQVVFKGKPFGKAQGDLTIINDTTATSPDGGIAALRRFASPSTILITGGTDRGLDFKEWARVVKQTVKPGNVIFLDGSATDKMLKALGPGTVPSTQYLVPRTHGILKECFNEAMKKAGKYRKSVVLFSPASKSFEKFLNEFDRGKQFNKLVKRFANSQ